MVLRGFAPFDEILRLSSGQGLVFRQKHPKPFTPVCGPPGLLRRSTESFDFAQDRSYDCGTRSAQTVLAELSESAL